MSVDENKLPKDVRLVHALMTLRGLSPHELALHTGVQIENLQAWLQGTASALAHRSYIALLSYLGLTRDGYPKRMSKTGKWLWARRSPLRRWGHLNKWPSGL